jgi:hypothetical protein
MIRTTGSAEGNSISEGSSEKMGLVSFQLVDCSDELAKVDRERLQSSEPVATRGGRRNPNWKPTSIRHPEEDNAVNSYHVSKGKPSTLGV